MYIGSKIYNGCSHIPHAGYHHLSLLGFPQPFRFPAVKIPPQTTLIILRIYKIPIEGNITLPNIEQMFLQFHIVPKGKKKPRANLSRRPHTHTLPPQNIPLNQGEKKPQSQTIIPLAKRLDQERPGTSRGDDPQFESRRLADEHPSPACFLAEKGLSVLWRRPVLHFVQEGVESGLQLHSRAEFNRAQE